MKLLLIATCLVSVAAGEALAAPAFSWFHTRPKSVLLVDETSASAAKTTRIPYHGTAMYPGSGRLYFSDKVDQNRAASSQPQARSRMTTVFSRGWNGESAKTSSPIKSSEAK